MPTAHRVRAILINPHHQLMMIKRSRKGHVAYWVTPGGAVLATDGSLEAALHREIAEQITGKIEILKPVLWLEHQITEDDYLQQTFFLCRLLEHQFDQRTGAEFIDTEPGEYTLDALPLTAQQLAHINIKPDRLKALLVTHSENLLALPAVRV